MVIVGSCNYDQIVYVPDFPAPGATIYGSSYATGFGGKGADAGVDAGDEAIRESSEMDSDVAEEDKMEL